MRKPALGAMLAIVAVGVPLLGAPRLSRRFLFPFSQVASQAAPPDFTKGALSAPDGVTVHLLELPARPGARTVVHFHNNRETTETAVDFARALHRRDFGIVLVEYRGYGASRDSSPSETGLYLDAETVLDMLRRRGIGPDRVVLSGTSLGTGVAAEMARRGRASCLVLISPYTSIPDLVNSRVPFVPARALVADQFDTLAKASEIHVPTLVIHGDADEIVPFAMGQELTRVIGGARLLRVSSGHHGDLFVRDGERLLSEIAALGT